MPSSYSPSLKIQLMATGEDSGTWGQITNLNLGTALEEAITGSADVLFSGADVTLTLTNTPTAQTARNMRLNLTGSSGGSRTLTVPATEKLYIINNTLADPVDVRPPTGVGVIVPAGKTMWVYCTGGASPNVVDVVNHASSLSLTTPLALTSGGTGATTAATARAAILPAYAGNANYALVVNGGATDVTYAAVGNVFTTTAQTLSNKTLLATKELTSISGSGASGTVPLYVSTGNVLYYTGSAGGNWTLNVTGDSGGGTLNSLMAVNEAITVTFLATNGGTAYRQTAFSVDGNSITPKWQGGTVPTQGNANSIDAYIATIIKTGAGTFTVLEAQTRFA
jgi:hypothetical protein